MDIIFEREARYEVQGSDDGTGWAFLGGYDTEYQAIADAKDGCAYRFYRVVDKGEQ